MKYLGNRGMDLFQIHNEDVWSLTQTSLKVKVKGHRSRSSRRKHHFSALSAACVQFMFGKISEASSFPISASSVDTKTKFNMNPLQNT